MTRRLGNRNEERVCWYYKALGYEVWMPNWARIGKTGIFRSADIFGIFDIIATCKKKLIFVQVKTEKCFRKKVCEEIQAISLPQDVEREYWTFDEKGDAKVRKFYSTGFEDRVVKGIE
jgi:Holliday junction resolvase-like predicted endonuclease